MPITTSNSTIPHSPNVFFNQTLPATAALPNGGYVVAWSDDANQLQRDIRFQIYNGAGEAVGAVQTANSVTAGNQELRDVVATADGKFTLLWSTGTTLTARTFDGTTGAAASTEQNLTTADNLPVNGAQMIVTGASSVKVEFSSNTSIGSIVIEAATLNTSTGLFGGKSPVGFINTLDFAMADIDPGNGSDHFALLTSGSLGFLLGNNGISIALPANVGTIAKIQENVHLVVQESGNGGLNFAPLTGFTANLSDYVLSAPVQLSGAGGGNTGQSVHAMTSVSLGGGRVLVLWVADTGISGPSTAVDGVYGVVFDAVNRTFEDGIQLVSALVNINPADATIDAQLMADGRVTLAVGVPNSQVVNFNQRDVRSLVVDPRNSGVTITGTAQTDTFVGSAFADTFQNIGANDVVNGGIGTDTVFLAANVARTIDLIDANRFPAALSKLTGIEIINMGDLDDVLYGLTTADTVNGGGGNDVLVLREGSDTADGGSGNDTIFGASGADSLQGGIGNDVISGGADSDNLNGGADDDSITGGDGNDFIIGGDGADKLYGNAGDDTIDGGTGADFISGGLGNDFILGGADNDTITAGDGDDVIDAGAGNDFINAGAGFNVVDGGTGSDTISYSQSTLLTGQAGLYLDLDSTADPFGNTDGVLIEDDVLVNIENVIGGEGDDFIYGNSLANILRGSGGNDTLMGRGAGDTLIGGAGSDRYMFETASGANDVIRGFTVGEDDFLFVSTAFGNVHSGNIAASFVSNAAGTASIAAAQFVFDNSGAGAGRLFYDADGTGAGAATLMATITFATPDGATTFGAGDFLFI